MALKILRYGLWLLPKPAQVGTMAMLYFCPTYTEDDVSTTCQERIVLHMWWLPSLTKDLTEWATMEVKYANPFRDS